MSSRALSKSVSVPQGSASLSTCLWGPAIDDVLFVARQAGTRTKGIELCMLYIEGEEDMAEGVIASPAARLLYSTHRS